MNHGVMRPSDRTVEPTTVGIAGLGTIGTRVAESLVSGVDGYRLTAVSVRTIGSGRDRLAAIGAPADVAVVDLAELAEYADIIIECLPADKYESLMRPALDAGGTVITLTCSALLQHWDLVDRARRSGGSIMVPTGALLALDAVQAAANSHIDSVSMVTTKPVAALQDDAHLHAAEDIPIESLTEPVQIFVGSARDASARYPANLNVAAALALAGIGPDRTMVELWADPHATRNRHEVTIEADVAHMHFTIEGTPSANPRTGQLAALSVIALLRKNTATLRIGT